MCKPTIRRSTAFTLLELLLVIAIIAILAALLLPALESARARGKQAQCLSQLKQLGVAYHMYAHEHDFKGQVQVSTNADANWATWGLGEDLFRRFQLLSNELSTPAILRCPSDRDRTRVDSFAALRDENISYTLCFYLFLLGDTEKPVSTDRNIQMDAFFLGGPVHWTGELHQRKGNILFHDGHVEKTDDRRLGQVMSGLGVRPVLQFPERSTGSAGSSSGGAAGSGNGADGRRGGRTIASGNSRGSEEAGSGFTALQSFFQPKGPSPFPASGGNPTTPSGSSPIVAGVPPLNLPDDLRSAPASTNAPTNRIMAEIKPTLSAQTQALAVAREEGVSDVAASSAPPIVNPDSGSYYWLLFLLLAAIVAVLFGVILQRRRGCQPAESDDAPRAAPGWRRR